MANIQNNHISIRSRLRLVSLVVGLVFILMAISLYKNSSNVRTSINHAVVDSVDTIVNNSQSSRDFGLLNVRLNVFKNTFYLDNNWFEAESKGLQRDIESLKAATHSPDLKSLLSQLQEQFTVYQERRSWVNYLLFWRSEQDQEIGAIALLVQDIIDEKIANLRIVGAATGDLNDLRVLLSGYRVSLLEMAKLNAEENPIHLLSTSIDAPIPLTDELHSLITQLQPLTMAAPPVDRLSKHLVDHFLYYQYLMQQYLAEMVRLGELNQNLDQLSARILTSMEQLDRQTVATVENVRGEVNNLTLTAVTTILILLFLVTLITWIFLKNLFNKHIQSPLEMVSARLQQFEEGDHRSLMQLERYDEWNNIETGFNRMLSSLEKSVVALKGSEKHYKDIHSNMKEGIFRATLSGKIIDLNPAAVSILGFDSLFEGLHHLNDVGKKLFVDPQARQQMAVLLSEKKALVNHEVEVSRQKGGTFWVSLYSCLIYDETGTAIGAEGVITDITSRKAAQDSLQQLQSYLQNIIDSMPFILIGVNADLEVTLWNKRAEQENILSAAEVKGRSLEQVCQLFKSTVYMLALEETLRIKKPVRLLKVESLKKGKDGRSRYFDILIYPLSLAGEVGAVIHLDDVTERSRLE